MLVLYTNGKKQVAQFDSMIILIFSMDGTYSISKSQRSVAPVGEYRQHVNNLYRVYIGESKIKVQKYTGRILNYTQIKPVSSYVTHLVN